MLLTKVGMLLLSAFFSLLSYCICCLSVDTAGLQSKTENREIITLPWDPKEVFKLKVIL